VTTPRTPTTTSNQTNASASRWLGSSRADDSDINKITWENSCRFFSWDPSAHTPREQANVGALRAKGADVDVSIRPRKEWARLYAEQQLAKA
jgi:hypothetical protein